MVGLRLTLDPGQMEAGAKKAESALEAIVRMATEAETSIKGLGASGDEVGKLKAKFDPAYAAGLKLRDEITELDRALKIGAIDAEIYASRISGMNAGLMKVSDVSEKVGRSGMIAGGGMRNLSLQLSQVVQQGGMTGNYLGALAIQIPDMMLSFGMLGVVIGGLAVVGLPMLQLALGDTSAAEKQAQDQLDSLMSTMSDFNRDAKIGATSVADLRKEYGLWADEIQQTAQWMAQVDASAALATLSKDTTSFSATLDKLTIAQQNASDALAARFAAEKAVGDPDIMANNVAIITGQMMMYNAQVDALATTLGMTATQALQLQNGLTAVTSSDDMTALANNAKAVLDQIEQWYPAGALMPPEMVKISQGMQDIESAAARGVTTMGGFAPALDSATGSAGGLLGVMGDISGAAWSAWQYMVNMGNAASAIKYIADNQPGGISDMANQYSQYGQGHAAMVKAQKNASALYNPPGMGVPRSGGGRSAEIKGQIIDLNALIALEAEATDYWGEWGDAGASALDKLISGTGDLGDILKDTIKEMELAILKQTLLATLGMSAGTTGSIGSIIMGALIPHANGGTIPVGSTGMVGENGPEAISSTPYGTVVTSRSASANSSQAGAQNVNVTVGVSVDDDGKVQAYVKSMTTSAAKASAAMAVQTVKRSLSSWNGQLQTDGALA